MTSSVESRTVVDDPALPTLKDALTPQVAERLLLQRLPLPETSRLASVRLLAHKPGRRALVEYEFDVPDPECVVERVAVIGKIRVNRFGNSGFRQLRALWQAGFDDQSPDGVSVPQPLGTIPDLCMWLQRKVEGRVVTQLLGAPPPGLSEGIARAVQKLHNVAVPVERRHSINEEMAILQRCLTTTAEQHPRLASDIHQLQKRAGQVAYSIPSHDPCPSHRDFYSDQLVLAGDRLYLLDFDLFCMADPGLDLGNFLGHLTEYAVRQLGSPTALARLEGELEDHFVARAGEALRHSVRAYAALTLARHVFLCTRFTDRIAYLPAILALALERVDAVAARSRA